MIDAHRHGAVGDGVADDTQPLRDAIGEAVECGGGLVNLKPGCYRTDTIALPSHVTLRGEGAWSYRDPGSTVLLPVRDDQPCLIDLSESRGGRLVDLGLHGEARGTGMHGVAVIRPRPDRKAKTKRAVGAGPPSRAERLPVAMAGDTHLQPLAGEQNIVIDNCWIGLFSGSGVHLERSHVYCVRHSLIVYNGIDGIDASRSCDAWIMDNQVGFNGRYGMHIGSSTTITANRMEQNDQAGLRFNDFYVEDNVVTGNHFCSNRGPGIEMVRLHDEGNVRGVTITGNHLRNSGCGMTDDIDRCCHIRLIDVAGVTCTGNMLHALRGSQAPMSAMVIRGLADSVIQSNSMYKAAMAELIRDLGGHTNTVVRDNPGSVKQADDVNA